MNPAPNNWIVTLYFYSALHLVEENRWRRFKEDSENHSDRKRYVKRKLRCISDNYLSLYNDSVAARYDCVDMTDEKVQSVKTEYSNLVAELDKRFPRPRRFRTAPMKPVAKPIPQNVPKSIPKPDNVLEKTE